MRTSNVKRKSRWIAAGVLAAVLVALYLYFSPMKISYQTTGVLVDQNTVDGYGDDFTPGINIEVDGVLKWVYFEQNMSWQLVFEGTFVVGGMDFSDYTTTLSTLYFAPSTGLGHFLMDHPPYGANPIYATPRFEKAFIEFLHPRDPVTGRYTDYTYIAWPAQTREEAIQVIENWKYGKGMWRRP